jgi:hypothetical protein
MVTFNNLWAKHVGRAYVCDSVVFENQCAMRMGQALTDVGVSLAGKGLRTCVDYNRRRFASHAPGHVRSAQQLGDVFTKTPTLLGAGVIRDEWPGTIDTNLAKLKGRKGMIFIKNGWGPTDHIDVWDGAINELRGGDATYFSKGTAIWFWEIGA